MISVEVLPLQDTAHDSSEIMSEPRVRIVTPGVEEALRAMYAEAGETGIYRRGLEVQPLNGA